jgi:PAS domain S-box-containing protein
VNSDTATQEEQTTEPRLALQLLEPRGSADFARIQRAADAAGLQTEHLESIEGVSPDAPLVAVGPGIQDPLHAARYLRRIGSHAVLMFLAASREQRAELHAELIRDPFLYSRCELMEVPDNPRQLASRMGRVVAQVKLQHHTPSTPRRRPRPLRKGAAREIAPPPDEPYLANILAHVRDALFSIDNRFLIQSWNTSAERLFGLTAEQALGQPLDMLNAPEPYEPRLTDVATTVARSRTAEHTTATCFKDDGTTIDIDVSIAPLIDRQGTLLGLSLIARDQADDDAQREALLRETKRQKDEFLAIMSHELRTPLTSILGYTDLLLRGFAGPLGPVTNKYVGNVRSAGDRLLDLVNGLLDYTRLEAGVERLDLHSVELPRIVTQSVHQYESQATARSIDLRLSIEPTPLTRVQADEDKLLHVLRAFLNNALKFTPDGGSIQVRLATDPERADLARVSVADTGIGIHPHVLPRVWERFYQGDATLTRPYGGMGLGLSIARHLVTLHGGSVGAASAGPGLGSTFWFSLPVC